MNDRVASETDSGPPYCQTPLSNNYKTVIRKAREIDAKLGQIKYADGNGDAPYLVPTPRIGGQQTGSAMRSARLTYLFAGGGRAGFSSSDGQIGYVTARRGVAISRPRRTAHARHKRLLSVRSGGCSTDSTEGLEREYATDRGHDGPTQPSALISEPSNRWLSIK